MHTLTRPKARRAVALTAAVGLLPVSLLVAAAPAGAAPGDVHSQTFDYTGTPETFTVPAGVSELTIDLWGGDGGDMAGGLTTASGGAGSHVQFTIATSTLSGSTLDVYVGGNGESYNGSTTFNASGRLGGWNGGGNGGGSGDGQPGAGGGGRTELLDGSTVLAVAGGGGGAGGANVHPSSTPNGGAGGAVASGTTADGAAGADGDGTSGGGGATASAGGTSGSNAAAGVAGAGGVGGTPPFAMHSAGGGGGGAGVYGGGGGSADFESTGAGGGGGSSAVFATATNVSFAASATGVGRITISWVEADVAPAAPTDLQATVGDGTATFSWTAPASNGGTAVQSYTVTLTPGGLTCTATAPATSCTISGLTNGVAYSAAVTATNGAGTSVLGVSITATPTAAAVPTTTAAPVPTTAAPAPEVAPAEETTDVPTLALTGSSSMPMAAFAMALLLAGLALIRVQGRTADRPVEVTTEQ